MSEPIEVGRQLLGAGARGMSLLAITTCVERRHRRRPAQPDLVVVLFGDDCDESRHPNAVGAHGQSNRLAVLAEHVDLERVGVLAA